VIASQALISGAYSLTMQAVQLGYIPRVKIKHTSASAFGQIYIGTINWAMMIACIGLVVGFRSSTNLAAAYGLAVTATMVITTVLLYVVLRERFEWSAWTAGVLCSFFLIIDVGFLAANLFKIPDGGWFPLLVAAIVFTLMTTWRTGRQLVAERIHRGEILLTDLMDAVSPTPIPRVPGVAIFLFSTPRVAPPALIANLRYNKVLHDRTYILSIRTQDIPRVLPRTAPRSSTSVVVSNRSSSAMDSWTSPTRGWVSPKVRWPNSASDPNPRPTSSEPRVSTSRRMPAWLDGVSSCSR
jgi:KUP system potassium uptake protein